MTLRYLQKWHGAGNDFLVEVIEHGTAPWWDAAHARAVCDRSTGVGADGLLLATVGSDVTMVLYNADGSRAEMSGNGIRCLAAAVRRSTRGTWDALDVVTDAGVRRVTLTGDRDEGAGSVAMGAVTTGPGPAGTLGVASVGNPHVVVVDDPAWTIEDRTRLASAWSDDLGGANVEFITPVDSQRIELRVFERGVGWTQACGTGSCAVAAVARSHGLCGDAVTIGNPGGDLTVRLDGDQATLGGPVQFVANVEWRAT